jgi:CRP/FNR family transcriptional regulator
MALSRSEHAIDTERITALRCTALFGSLTESEIGDIAQKTARLHFRKGEILFLSGEEATGIFVIVSGKVRVFQQNAQGREQVLLVATAGAIIADVPVFDNGSYPASAVSESDVDVLFIEKRDVHKLCAKCPSLALKALELMASRVRSHAQLVEALSFHDVEHRLALFLVTEAQHSGCAHQGRIAFRLLLSNQEIASRIGSVRDVVSRALARLKHSGLIETQGRFLVIPDMDALRLYASNAAGVETIRSKPPKQVTQISARPPG